MGCFGCVVATIRILRVFFAQSRVPEHEAQAKFQITRLAQGDEEATPTKERMTMFALVEGHPKLDVIIFYVLVSAILAATLYHFHQKQV